MVGVMICDLFFCSSRRRQTSCALVTGVQTCALPIWLWPIGKFPLLREGGRVVPEATSIIEYLHVHHPGPVRLIPEDAEAALEVRRLDRFFDKIGRAHV